MKKIMILTIELLYFIISASLFAGPPGLSGKGGGLPHGLEMQGKTPHGWSEGKKEGWNKIHHHGHHGHHHNINSILNND